MPKCRLCRSCAADSSEHVVPNALGGRRSVRDFICGKCNNDLGKSVDAPFEEAFRVLSLCLGCYRGNKKPVASWGKIRTQEGKLRLVHGGRFAGVIGRPVLPSDDHVVITAETEQKAAELLVGQCDLHDLPLDGLELIEPRFVRRWVDGITIELNFGTKEEHYRAVVKMALSSIVDAKGRSFVDNSSLDMAAEYIYSGRCPLPCALDCHGYQTLRSFTKSAIGVHVLAVFDNPRSGRLEVAFSAFNTVLFRVDLGPEIGLGHTTIIDRVDPRHRARGHEKEVMPGVPELPAMSTLAANADRRAPVLEELIEFVRVEQQQQLLRSLVHDVVNPGGALKGELSITKEHIGPLVERIMEELELPVCGEQVLRPIAAEEIIAKAIALLHKAKR